MDVSLSGLASPCCDGRVVTAHADGVTPGQACDNCYICHRNTNEAPGDTEEMDTMQERASKCAALGQCYMSTGIAKHVFSGMFMRILMSYAISLNGPEEMEDGFTDHVNQTPLPCTVQCPGLHTRPWYKNIMANQSFVQLERLTNHRHGKMVLYTVNVSAAILPHGVSLLRCSYRSHVYRSNALNISSRHLDG